MFLLASDSDYDDEVFYPDETLFNDLDVSAGFLESAEYTMNDLYYQQVVTNRMLGIIIALFLIIMIFGLMKFIMHLVRDNITNHF